jgi:choloylglycine hydrolase
MKKSYLFLLLLAAAALLAGPADACTGITVKAQDGAVIHARTTEFSPDLKSQVLIIPRGVSLASLGQAASRACAGKPSTARWA